MGLLTGEDGATRATYGYNRYAFAAGNRVTSHCQCCSLGVVPAWYLLSARYTANASGTVRVILGQGGVRADRVWNLIELPTLKMNPNVTRIIRIDVKTGTSTTIFSR